MKQVHLTLQGKGGVGKSLVAALLTQFLRAKGEPVIAVDTDPVNATLYGYEAFNADRLELMKDGSLNERNFDTLMERIIAEDENFVVDNGASSFIPLSYYLAENDAFNLIAEHGKRVVIHTVVTGGQAMHDTMMGFAALVEQMPPEARIVVWLNEFFGEVVSPDGRPFEELRAYTDNKERVHGIVRIAKQSGSTYGQDIQMMLDRKLTFEQVKTDPAFGLMAKSRLSNVRKAIFDQLETVI